MNLSAYDKIKNDKTDCKIYNSSGFPYIITKTINYRKYYCFVTRYEPRINDTILYLVLLDDNPLDRPVAKTRRDDYGRLKFNLSIIANKHKILKNKNINISLCLETHADDGDIYKLEIESD